MDLNPLDVTDADAMAWLANLVWPEHDARRERLLAAIEVARADPPSLQAGDLLEELPRLVDEAGEHGRVVVFHSAVIAYLSRARPPPLPRHDDRRWSARAAATGSRTRAGGCCPRSPPPGPTLPEDLTTFVLGVDGRAVAWTHGHGRSMRWFGYSASESRTSWLWRWPIVS